MALKITKKGWRGRLHLHQRGRTPGGAEGFVVAWDARSPDGWFIYDTKVMTPEQIQKWTGVLPKLENER